MTPMLTGLAPANSAVGTHTAGTARALMLAPVRSSGGAGPPGRHTWEMSSPSGVPAWWRVVGRR